MNRILIGDVLEMLRTLPDCSVNCVVTSPPYFGLRDYGMDGQIGLEKTPAEFIQRLSDVFREVRRVLVDDGTCWVNMGDSYGGSTSAGLNDTDDESLARRAAAYGTGQKAGSKVGKSTITRLASGTTKNLMGMPWRLAFALQDDGWFLRQDIIWAKPNPMPESVRDRCTKAHEYIFLLTKNAKYFYDQDAIAEDSVDPESLNGRRPRGTHMAQATGSKFFATRTGLDGDGCTGKVYATRNKRSVWAVATQPYPEAHFATFPEEIPRLCISAGCPVGGVVLDPFAGSGTTCAVAKKLGREYIGIEINPAYAALAEKRISAAQQPLAGLF